MNGEEGWDSDLGTRTEKSLNFWKILIMQKKTKFLKMLKFCRKVLYSFKISNFSKNWKFFKKFQIFQKASNSSKTFSLQKV